MFSKIKAFFVGVEHDVEAIISGFTDTVAKLEAAAAAKRNEAIDLATEANALKTASEVAHEAAAKARTVAGKIKALVA